MADIKILENSLDLCPIGCLANACSTDSGTGVGPGIIKNSFSRMEADYINEGFGCTLRIYGTIV